MFDFGIKSVVRSRRGWHVSCWCRCRLRRVRYGGRVWAAPHVEHVVLIKGRSRRLLAA